MSYRHETSQHFLVFQGIRPLFFFSIVIELRIPYVQNVKTCKKYVLEFYYSTKINISISH